jgi:signal transduction histidine kinase
LNRLQTRLLAASFGVALIALAAVALAARQTARHEFLKFQSVERQSMLTRRLETTKRIAGELNQLCCVPAVVEDASRQLNPAEAVLVLTGDGKTLVASGGDALKGIRDLSAAVEGGELHVELTRVIGQRFERGSLKFAVAGTPLALADGSAALAFVIPVPPVDEQSPVTAFFGSFDRWLLSATVVASLLALGATWAATRTAIAPLAELQRATADLASGDFSRRVATTGPEEIATLAASFNRMAAELDTQQGLRRNLVHDVAHELRTPLTALRCRLEAVQDGLVTDTAAEINGLHEQVQHLSQLVDDLQELALAESRELRLQMSTLDMRPLITSAVRAAGLDGDTRVRVDVGAQSIAGDAVRMRQVLTNLLTNAARHTASSGTITIRTQPMDGRVRVDVHNTGSSLNPDQLARIFDRFYRTDPSRQRDTGGTGLGLAIVKHLVEAQGGRVRASSDAAGVTVGFDASATSSSPPPSPSAPSAPASGA